MKHSPFLLRPTLLRLLAVAIYESLILVAIWVLGTAVFLSINGVSGSEMSRWSLRIFLWALSGFYFVWCWIKSGQTLAAQTWKVKLVNAQSAPLSLNHAILRYVLATVSLLVFGLGFLWAVFDKDHLFFHDRLLNTHFERRW
ncbi:MAG TPA: RDD family protein [Methylophilus sp.]|mgnify:CR=1 FL=1|nr:RDD family protein [Methylophilus sp.]HQQ32749.1 RDD family protein [Methylophilus sp.]